MMRLNLTLLPLKAASHLDVSLPQKVKKLTACRCVVSMHDAVPSLDLLSLLARWRVMRQLSNYVIFHTFLFSNTYLFLV